MADMERIGVGALLTINGETPAFKRFYDELSPRLGHPPERNSLHLTLVDSGEAAIDILSPRDNSSLLNTQNAFNEYLGRQSLNEVVLHPSAGPLEKLGGRLCILLEEVEAVREFRASLNEILGNELGESVSSRDFVPHISVLNGFTVRSKRGVERPRPPANLHVTGFFTGQRATRNWVSRKSSQRYVNQPGSSRGS